MKVIVGVDGSAGSCFAVQLAGRLLSAEKDEAFLHYAPPQIRVRPVKRGDTSELEELRRHLCETVFAEARRRLPAELRDRIRALVGTQAPAHGLLVAADEYRADMIIVGARGSGPLDELAVGSVARAVVHHSTVPVLVVRPPVEEGMPNRLRVLLASDGSPSSKHAGEVIKGLSWPAGTVGRVITVVESPLVGRVPKWLQVQLDQQEAESLRLGSFEQTQEEQQLVREGLASLCGELPATFQGQEPMVAVGHASEEILKAIRAEKIDIVVVGARGLGPVRRFVPGSTSEHLLSQAPCSVLIARQHEAP